MSDEITPGQLTTACNGYVVTAGWVDEKYRVHCNGCAALAAGQAERDALKRELADLQVTYSAKVMDVDAEHAREVATLKEERDRLYEQSATDLVQHGDLCGQIEALEEELATHVHCWSNERHEADLDDLKVDVERLNGELAEMTERERVAWAEIHVQAARNQRLTEDVVAGTSNINRQLVADRYRLEAELATAAASLERARAEMIGVIERLNDLTSLVRAWGEEQVNEDGPSTTAAEAALIRWILEYDKDPRRLLLPVDVSGHLSATPPAPIATPGTEAKP